MFQCFNRLLGYPYILVFSLFYIYNLLIYNNIYNIYNREEEIRGTIFLIETLKH